MPIRKSAKTRIAALRAPPLRVPALPPRNPVTRALVAKSLSVGVGKHQKTPGGQRQAAKKAMRAAMVADLGGAKTN